MATVTLTRNKTLPDSSAKSDFHDLVDTATAAITGIVNADIDAAAAIALSKLASTGGLSYTQDSSSVAGLSVTNSSASGVAPSATFQGGANNATAHFTVKDYNGNTDFSILGTGEVIPANDFYTVAWTDYSGTSTIVGWASYVTKKIYYKKIGKLVFVEFNIDGTSNSTSTTFTLPYTKSNTTTLYTYGFSVDNGSAAIVGLVNMTANTAIVTCSHNVTGAAASYTNSGNKTVNGQLFYEATA